MLPTPRQLNDNDENEQLEAIRNLQRDVSGAQRSIAVSSSMANGDNIHLIAGEGDPYDDSGDNPFTGTAILYPAFEDTNGNWHIIGMNAGTLQFGLSATDGKAYAGAGVVVLDADGISLLVDGTYKGNSSIKFIETSTGTVHSEVYNIASLNTNSLNILSKAVTGKSTNLEIEANAPTGETCSVTISSSTASGTTPTIVLVDYDTDQSTIHINDNLVDVDTVIYGDTVAVIAVDAGLDSATINKLSTTGATTINSTSADVDTIINGDTVPVITVDASTDSATINKLSTTGATVINSNSADADTTINGDTAAVITVDAGTNSATVNNLTVTGTAGNVLSGTYTPTLSNTTNISASTAAECQYVRVGNMVTVSGRVAIDATAAGSIVLGVTIPVASNFAADANCGGAAASAGIHQSLAISADTTNDRATFQGVVTDTANRSYFFSFTYRII